MILVRCLIKRFTVLLRIFVTFGLKYGFINLRSNFRTGFDAQNAGNGVSAVQISTRFACVPKVEDYATVYF